MLPLKEVSPTVAFPVLRVPKRLLPGESGEGECRFRLRGNALSTFPRTDLARSSKEAEGGQETSTSPL